MVQLEQWYKYCAHLTTRNNKSEFLAMSNKNVNFLLRIECEDACLVASYEEERWHIPAKTLQPGHIKGR